MIDFTSNAESIAVALLALAGVVYTAVRGARGEKRGQDWERIEGLWRRVDQQEERIGALEKRVASLQSQNGAQAQQISRLERWRTAAQAYIAALLATLRDHDITPPRPPADYTEQS